MAADCREMLDFWFSDAMRRRWFASTPKLDAEIRDRFEGLWQQAAAGTLDAWQETPEGALALVIVLDQLPRNMYRGRPESFSTAQQAVAVAKHAIEHGFDQRIGKDRLAFLFMPLMHSERLDDQDASVRLFAGAGLADNLRWAEHHRDIVRRFGRFPHRNAILGRESTREEQDYLASPRAFKG
ncbi:MAG: DUF924 domain-containing protein [Betaproteobacteria bacterium]|nr:DUF924 domain-containing protein [Betaproteobacteria bacterium]